MKLRILRQAAVGIAGLGLLLPPQSSSAADPVAAPAPPSTQAPLVADIALGAGGMLSGQVVNSAGQGVPGIAVRVLRNEALVATSTSGAEGKFSIAGLQGGMFQVSADQGMSIFRLWAPETAPPAAGKSALIVHDVAAVRGQSALARMLASPLVIAGIVALAVAIPVAVHNIREDHRSGS